MATNQLSRVYKISVDGAQAVRQLEKISGSAASVDQRFAKFGANLRKLFAAGAVIAAVKTFANDMQAVVDKFDGLAKASQSAGVTVEQLTKLQYAAGLAGVQANELDKALVKLSVNMDAVSDLSTDAGKRLASLGVTAGDDTASAFNKIAESLSAMPDGFQKTAAAVEIFGKSGANLIPLLNGGADGLAAAAIEAEIFGQVIKNDAAKNAEIFNDNMSRLGMIGQGVMNDIATSWLPTMAKFTEALVTSYKQSLNLGEALFVAFGLPLITNMTQATEALVLQQVVVNDLVADLERLKAAGEDAFNFTGALESRIKIEQTKLLLIQQAGEALTAFGKKREEQDKNLTKPIKDPMVAWYEGLEKASKEMDRLQPKLVKLADEMDLLTASGLENSSIFKVLSEEYEKLFAQASKDDVGTNIMLGLRKTKEEAALTAEKIAFLQQTIESMLATGNTADAAILTKTMKELQAQTESVGTTFEQAGENIALAIAGNANNAVNSFIDNIGQAEISFGDFATSVLKDITKMILQLLVLKPLMDSIKGYFGGPTGGLSFSAQGNAFAGGTGLSQGVYSQPKLFEFAQGGMFGRNIGVLGEGSGPEAIMPLRRTASGDLGVIGAPVNVNVYNNAGTEVKTQESMSPDGTRQIDIYIERKMREGISNGSYDKAFRGAYGLSRMGA